MFKKQSQYTSAFNILSNSFKGELFFDKMMRIIYATDASEYRELPLAVAYPKDENDIILLIDFCNRHQVSMIPRAAGTSLAGQCVGDGIIVDISKYFNKILKINIADEYVEVQPGVVRDQLNLALKDKGYFFSPITSTANRAMMGGMVGNNSSGTTSIKYGVTRDKVIQLDTILSDGSKATFGDLTKDKFLAKTKLESLEGSLYRFAKENIFTEEIDQEIKIELPKPSIHRRNTGYAIEKLSDPCKSNERETIFNYSKLLTGSEGTLAFTTSIKLKIDPLPPSIDVVIAVHFNDLIESLEATQIVMTHNPYACELMDKIILDCTKSNLEQNKNRWFVEGDPATILMVECRGDTLAEAMTKAEAIIHDLSQTNYGYAYPIIPSEMTKGVWQLRSAGLGLLANISTTEKAVACIEDTAVALEDLPSYIREFEKIMEHYGQKSVYYAHAGAGEIHLRPILNLKKSADVKLFEDITRSVALLVKKYKGSLSGEHGDGRVRASFIPMMVGDKIYQLFKEIKHVWDPNNIFNPGKIVDAKEIGSDLRVLQDIPDPVFDTFMDFSKTNGILGMAEKCNGSGDCRKSFSSGGTMCPSYQATRDEKDTTRARANILREFLTRSDKSNPFDHKEIKDVLDLCISCKGCTSECPSNVDMSSLKAEFLYQWQQKHGISIRSRFFSRVDQLNALGQLLPSLTNFIFRNSFTSQLLKLTLGIAKERSLPLVSKISLRSWYKMNYHTIAPKYPVKSIYLFCDEFTNRLETDLGITCVKLLTSLNYKVNIVDHKESGRAAISKGDLQWAKKVAEANINSLSNVVTKESPLVGIEPSAILTFKDEYHRIVDPSIMKDTRSLSSNTFLIDDFLSKEMDLGNITSDQFDNSVKHIMLHGHCHQKALSDINHTIKILSLPNRFTVESIPSGCCGMAGSFGYENEHYDVSMKIGELVLFPKVRATNQNITIAALGTSCRHQIKDGTGRNAQHPIQILYSALK